MPFIFFSMHVTIGLLLRLLLLLLGWRQVVYFSRACVLRSNLSQPTCLQQKLTLLCLCLLLTAAAAVGHCSCPQPNSLPPVGCWSLSTAVHFLPPDLLGLADSYHCPQPSITHSPTHSTGHHLLRSTSTLTTCSHHSTCDQQRCVCCLYILPCCCYSRGAPRHVRSAVFHLSISAVVPSDPSVLHSLP